MNMSESAKANNSLWLFPSMALPASLLYVGLCLTPVYQRDQYLLLINDYYFVMDF